VHMGQQVKPEQWPSGTRGGGSGLRPGRDESGATWSELTAAWSALQRPGVCTQGGNGRWAGCPGGLGPIL
jgi:hypothetical protein